MAHLRNCILCGKEYDYCPRCDRTRPAYFIKYCSENCKEIHLVENRYSFNHLTQQGAADVLNTLDLSNLENFNETDKAYIKGILSINDKVKNEKVIENTDDEVFVSVNEVVDAEDVIEPNEIAVPTKPKFKKSNKKN